jgi:D-tyrosyl-tRNA(Tyr) deacylase
MAARLARLRVFPDADGRFDESLLDTGGAALVVSQFTLYGDLARGNRPSFSEAALPEQALPLYERVCERLLAEGVRSVERGRFGAHMQVDFLNDGPVTIILEV